MEPTYSRIGPSTTSHDAYQQIFDAIRLDVTFTIDELDITSDTAAYAVG